MCFTELRQSRRFETLTVAKWDATLQIGDVDHCCCGMLRLMHRNTSESATSCCCFLLLLPAATSCCYFLPQLPFDHRRDVFHFSYKSKARLKRQQRIETINEEISAWTSCEVHSQTIHDVSPEIISLWAEKHRRDVRIDLISIFLRAELILLDKSRWRGFRCGGESCCLWDCHSWATLAALTRPNHRSGL